jgi:hypothetical protein
LRGGFSLLIGVLIQWLKMIYPNILKKIDVNSPIDGRYPLHFAADYGQLEVLEYLVSYKK